jgi:hypothetical protein
MAAKGAGVEMMHLMTDGSHVNPEIEAAMRRLISGVHHVEGTYITLPVFYPSGSKVVVRVSEQRTENQTKFFVTDFGLGFQEAELMGIDRGFSRVARIVAERSGVGFDEHAFFAVQVDLERLPGAISAIASCSLEAVTTALVRLSEKASAGMSRILVEKLEATFGPERVKRDETLSGDSGHDWTVAATVQSGAGRVVFDVATKSPISIATVAIKMDDISRLKSAPRRFVMVRSTEELGSYLGVLAHHASVIEPTANENYLIKLVGAA